MFLGTVNRALVPFFIPIDYSNFFHLHNLSLSSSHTHTHTHTHTITLSISTSLLLLLLWVWPHLFAFFNMIVFPSVGTTHKHDVQLTEMPITEMHCRHTAQNQNTLHHPNILHLLFNRGYVISYSIPLVQGAGTFILPVVGLYYTWHLWSTSQINWNYLTWLIHVYLWI